MLIWHLVTYGCASLVLMKHRRNDTPLICKDNSELTLVFSPKITGFHLWQCFC
jgi:hypothetical protein